MRLSFFLLAGFLIISCTKKNTPSEALQEEIEMTAIKQDSGFFTKGPYGGGVSGKAVIYKSGETFQVTLQDFSVANGPDLKVYLSKEEEPQNFYNLGSLKSIKGNQVYDVPADVQVLNYKYVLIHCQQYNHLFAFALLSNR